MEDRTAYWDTVTPEKARLWLEKNENNRPVRDSHVTQLAQQMEQGLWQANGDAIRFNGSGGLLDGQHRLLAVLRSWTPIQTLIVSGLPTESFKTIDGVRKSRSGRDVLSIRGVNNAGSVAGALAVVRAYLTGDLDKNQAPGITPAEIEQYLARWPEIQDSVRTQRNAVGRGKKVASPAILSGLHFLFARVSREAADTFVEDLCIGASLGQRDPVWQLREKLLLHKGQSRGYLSKRQTSALIIKAWNHRLIGKQVRFFRFGETEAFPEIRGLQIRGIE